MNEIKIEITSEILKSWGHVPGREFGEALSLGKQALERGEGMDEIRELLTPLIPAPTIALRPSGELEFSSNIDAETVDEEANVEKVGITMTELMRTPTIVAGAIMPDACPAGPVGTIPVGGIVAAKNAIHPGMHSADICCSVMLSNFGDAEPEAVLDAAYKVTHFGPGGRKQGQRFTVSQRMVDAFRENSFLDGPKIQRMMQEHMGTQGDGNHFLFVGKSRATGDTCLITHHGSRGPGAVLYRHGMSVAEKFRKKLSPKTLKQNAWIPADSREGIEYWKALQLIRKWTKANHTGIHQATIDSVGGELKDRFWNEHNFVFKRGDLYYHGKGATPAWEDFASDANGLTLIPLNMAEPILVVRGKDKDHALGFSPHGAGRNYSRSEHKRRMGETTPEEMMAAETEGLDIRFHAGKIDPSELPSGYKNADAVVRQIKKYDLAEIEDYIDPYGCIMAGDCPPPWLERKRNRR